MNCAGGLSIPICIKNALPRTDCVIEPEQINCFSCKKIISNKWDRVTNCILCRNTCHYSCILKPTFCCAFCENENHLNSTISDLNLTFSDISFNPYNDISNDDNEKNMFFDDDIDDFCDTAGVANRTLSNCKLVNTTILNL